MNPIAIRCLNKIRYIYLNKYPSLMPIDILENQVFQYDYQGEPAGKYIKELLTHKQPCMISRLGATETSAIITYLNIINSKNLIEDSILYIRGKRGMFWWDDSVVDSMCNASGFFPPDKNLLHKFGERMIQDIQSIDVLGSWLNGEQVISPFLQNAIRVPLIDLEPYCHEHPWSEVLHGKTVLVIHPFEESIQSQYQKRKLLFKQPEILPDFELKTIKAVQSIAGNTANFNNWFDALNYMCDQIANTQFDFAIIGAGAYGLPLAAFVKKLGKKAIHLGGATQVLFGIRGARWDERPFYQHLFNEHWVRPLPSETPQNFTNVENGCYW